MPPCGEEQGGQGIVVHHAGDDLVIGIEQRGQQQEEDAKANSAEAALPGLDDIYDGSKEPAQRRMPTFSPRSGMTA